MEEERPLVKKPKSRSKFQFAEMYRAYFKGPVPANFNATTTTRSTRSTKTQSLSATFKSSHRSDDDIHNGCGADASPSAAVTPTSTAALRVDSEDGDKENKHNNNNARGGKVKKEKKKKQRHGDTALTDDEGVCPEYFESVPLRGADSSNNDNNNNNHNNSTTASSHNEWLHREESPFPVDSFRTVDLSTDEDDGDEPSSMLRTVPSPSNRNTVVEVGGAMVRLSASASPLQDTRKKPKKQKRDTSASSRLSNNTREDRKGNKKTTTTTPSRTNTKQKVPPLVDGDAPMMTPPKGVLKKANVNTTTIPPLLEHEHDDGAQPSTPSLSTTTAVSSILQRNNRSATDIVGVGGIALSNHGADTMSESTIITARRVHWADPVPSRSHSRSRSRSRSNGNRNNNNEMPPMSGRMSYRPRVRSVVHVRSTRRLSPCGPSAQRERMQRLVIE